MSALAVAALFALALFSAGEFAHIAAHGGLPDHQHAAVSHGDETEPEAFGHGHSRSGENTELVSQAPLPATLAAPAPVLFVAERSRLLLLATRQEWQPPPDRLSQSRAPPCEA